MRLPSLGGKTRHPRTYSAATELVDEAWDKPDEWTELGTFVDDEDDEDAASYRIQSTTHEFHGQKLRCVIVHSSSLDGRTEKSINRSLSKTETNLEDEVDTIEERHFLCEEDAREAAETWRSEQSDEYFELSTDVNQTERKKSREGPGRPPKDWDPYETVWAIDVEMNETKRP